MEKIKMQFRIKTNEIIEKEVIVSKQVKETLEIFHQNYELQDSLNGGVKDIVGGRVEKSKRVCRFCKKSMPEVTFKKEAHVIPQLWGKPKPISHFECDSCNEKFSVYESDFSQYFSINRAISGDTNKKGKTVKYKSKNNSSIKSLTESDIDSLDINCELKQQLKEDLKNNTKIIHLQEGSDEKEMIFNGNEILLNIASMPYHPTNVFRVFLKIGLSLISEDELGDFSLALNLLTKNIQILPKYEYKSKDVCYTLYKFKDLSFLTPLAYIYNKKSSNPTFIDKTFIILFKNFIYQIPVLSNENIKRKNSQLELRMPEVSLYSIPAFQIALSEDIEFHKEIEQVEIMNINLSKSELERNNLQKISVSGSEPTKLIPKSDKDNMT